MSVVWDPGQDWIQIFDRLLKHPQVSSSLKSQTDVPPEAKSGLGWMGWSPGVYQVFKNVTKTQSILLIFQCYCLCMSQKLKSLKY